MKKITSILSLLLALLLLCGTALAYEQDKNLNDPGVFPVCKETVKLTVGMAQNSTIEDMNTNMQTQMIKEKGNFDFEFITYPGNEMGQKLNLIVAAGGADLPDVILGSSTVLSDATVYTWAMSGVLADLTDYYANSAYYLKEAIERTGVDFLPMITSPDGRIYGIPAYNQSPGNEYPGRIFMYTPWLEKLNLKAPSTADELYNVLKAFKTQDPNGNGLADEVPLAGATSRGDWKQAIINAFVDAGNGDYIAVKDGTLNAAYTSEGWKQAMAYIHKLVSEELITPLSFTQDNAQLNAMLAINPTVVGAHVYSSMSGMPVDDPRRMEYDGIPPLFNAELGRPLTRYNPSVANVTMVISANCKNPEAAFRLGDILVSEELSIHTRWGERGVDYLEPKEGDVSIYAAMGYEPRLTAVLVWGSVQNKHWAQQGPYIRQYAIAGGQILNPNDKLNVEVKVAEILQVYRDAKPDEVIPKLIYTAEEIEQIAEIQTTIKSYVDECLALFATGGMSVEGDWDKFQNELKVIGVEEMLQVMQTAYDRMYK